jgi:hypothetical protein
MSNQRELIADLEAEIERLRDAAERCGKIGRAAKATVGVGVVCLALSLLSFKPVALVVGVAPVLGGLALHGSNRSTLDEIVARIRATEARRAEVIEGLELQTSPEGAMGSLY